MKIIEITESVHPDFEIETSSPPRGPASHSSHPGLVAARENLEKTMIHRALRETGWNKVEAASLLHVSRQYLFTLMKKYGLTSPPPGGGKQS